MPTKKKTKTTKDKISTTIKRAKADSLTLAVGERYREVKNKASIEIEVN
jgi:hypothetical protein